MIAVNAFNVAKITIGNWKGQNVGGFGLAKDQMWRSLVEKIRWERKKNENKIK